MPIDIPSARLYNGENRTRSKEGRPSRAMTVSLIIPTLNAGALLPSLIAALREQTLPPDEILIVDSSSEDGTAECARSLGCRVDVIDRAHFDHGGTRDAALRSTHGEIVVFMTQDALPASRTSLEQLLAPFADARVAAVGGRQIARPDARPYERLVRAYNYPAQSRIWTKDDLSALGVRAYLISDVFAAYRREAYLAVGGFDHPLETNEDMLIAQRLLAQGYALAYSGEACVCHSHAFTWRQQFSRNRAVGRFMERYSDRLPCSELGTGMALAKDVLCALLREGRLLECAAFALDCSARLLGNRAGRREARREKKE